MFGRDKKNAFPQKRIRSIRKFFGNRKSRQETGCRDFPQMERDNGNP
jgi:hypothetical protein